MNKDIIVGIDIGGTNTVYGFVDGKSNYLFDKTIPTYPNKDISEFVLRLVGSIEESKNNFFSESILSGIGIAAPGANHLNGKIESPSNFKWKDVKLGDMLKEHFDIPIAITNDANAAALGEMFFGSAQNMKNFIMLTIGTGLGSGIVIDGKIFQGSNGHAGEMGHMNIVPNGRQCSCGNYGCLETYISVTGLRRTVFNLLSIYNEHSEMRDISFNELTGKKISELALNNDFIAKKAFDFTGEILGKALANAAACFDPEGIILFGGLLESGSLLMEPTEKYFEQNLLNVYKNKIKIIKSNLQNGKAAVLGASSLVNKYHLC